MSELYFITSCVVNNRGKLCRFKTYETRAIFTDAFYLAYYAYINYIYEKYNICIYPDNAIRQRYDLTFEQIAEMYDIVHCIKNKEYSKKINSKKREWLQIF